MLDTFFRDGGWIRECQIRILEARCEGRFVKPLSLSLMPLNAQWAIVPLSSAASLQVLVNDFKFNGVESEQALVYLPHTTEIPVCCPHGHSRSKCTHPLQRALV